MMFIYMHRSSVLNISCLFFTFKGTDLDVNKSELDGASTELGGKRKIILWEQLCACITEKNISCTDLYPILYLTLTFLPFMQPVHSFPCSSDMLRSHVT